MGKHRPRPTLRLVGGSDLVVARQQIQIDHPLVLRQRGSSREDAGFIICADGNDGHSKFRIAEEDDLRAVEETD